MFAGRRNEDAVAVVGAGVAGLSAAKVLDREGVDYVVFEKNSNVSEFNCGEIYTSGCYNIPKPPSSATYYAAKNFIFHFDDEDLKVPLPADTVWVTDKDKILKHMADGLNICTGKPVRISDLEFRKIIDASGFPSQACKENITPKIDKMAVAVFYRVRGDFSSFFDKNLHFWWIKENKKYGYYWLFPKDVYHANVGVGYEIVDRAPKFKEIDEFLRKLKIDGYQVEMRGADALPLNYMRRFCYRYGSKIILVAGEGAGLMNFTFMAGIPLAIASGIEAAKAFIQNDPDSYDKTVKQKFFRELSNSYMLYRLKKRISIRAFKKIAKVIPEEFGMDVFHVRKIKLLKLVKAFL